MGVGENPEIHSPNKFRWRYGLNPLNYFILFSLKDKNIYSFKIGGTIKALKELNKIYENANIYLERKYNAYKIIYKKYSEN